jgi:hypothetical protein
MVAGGRLVGSLFTHMGCPMFLLWGALGQLGELGVLSEIVSEAEGEVSLRAVLGAPLGTLGVCGMSLAAALGCLWELL